MTAVDALQHTLAAEHAAVYVYGALGGMTSQASAAALYATLTEGYDAHRTRRDALVAQLGRRGERPVAAEAVYDLPADLAGEGQVRRAARSVERACAETYAALVSETTGDLRSGALAALAESALRELDLGAEPQHFPGVPELRDR
ncbi:ferritin-like domain-containing protein [Nocardioides rotundus]|uniref:DUF4439 domain-containing protein n=1 Tax=Nocardioides rotundus TaxID=1774216 RepID=UPI001CC03518|nr:DUF4439 domain-containing protein [Nocardioides rotundus]UAL28801.1 ferritin-like domain-containing protein [Nocardioides rotundus]